MRVEDLAKIIASVLPARGVSRYFRPFIRSARSKSCSISLRVKSVIWRKSRFAKSSPPESVKMTGYDDRRILPGGRGKDKASG